MVQYLSHLECSRCHRIHDGHRLQNLCACGGPLLARYDWVKLAVGPRELAARPPGLWRYRELLPVQDPEGAVSLGEGGTPLLSAARLGKALGLPRLMLKDEGFNPTGTFKARGAAVGVARAKELGVRTIALPTNGNAGGAWAAYGTQAGLEVVLCMPTDAPSLAVAEAVAFGARSYMVDGQITDAGRIISRSAARNGWFEAATLKEPYRIEGKKTMGIEIAEQLGWRLPDVILYPTGGGVGLIGIYKALTELQALGWVEGPLPRLVAVQAAGCAPIVRAYEAGGASSEPWAGPATVAQGIRVPKALGDFLVLEAVRATGGICVAVEEAEIQAALEQTARLEGLLLCPEGAAAVAGAQRLIRSGWLDPGWQVVVLNTGSGLKYPELWRPEVPVLPLDAEI